MISASSRTMSAPIGLGRPMSLVNLANRIACLTSRSGASTFIQSLVKSLTVLSAYFFSSSSSSFLFLSSISFLAFIGFKYLSTFS
ncbi:hypothetical protein HanIR_Chr13g0623981 [Helianthus annuus]|nr:hypothetical protein HanIR_Chr13g0623981 [Helianthus annuus]